MQESYYIHVLLHCTLLYTNCNVNLKAFLYSIQCVIYFFISFSYDCFMPLYSIELVLIDPKK